MLEITIGLEWVLGRYFEMAGKPSGFPNYSSGTWGPPEADRIIGGDDGQHNPNPEEAIG